jgi:hypothetical protein
VADEHDSAVSGQAIEVRQSQLDVLAGRRPAAARDADAAVLDVPGRDAVPGERDAEVAGVDQAVDRVPVAAVEDDRERRRLAGGDSEIPELERLGPVGEPRVGRGRSAVGEDVLARPRQV